MNTDNQRIKSSHYTIAADVPASVVFAFVSDIHDRDSKAIFDAVDTNPIDALLVGGDVVHNVQKYKNGIYFLECAAKKYPTFCSLGNHEMKYEGDVMKLLAATGATILNNCSVNFKGINIGGLTSGFGIHQKQGEFKTTPAPDLEWLEAFGKKSGYKLLLSHHPEYYPRYIIRTPIELTLSGHAHGGQWRIFGRGVFAPGQGLFPRYTSGMYDGRLIVSRGLGNPHSIPRINNAPEVIFVRLALRK